MEGAKPLAIVGGGAAGLCAAIAAGQRAEERGLAVDVSVLEADERVGRSILATGNGRCNFSNSSIDVGQYRNGAFAGCVYDALVGRFGPDYVHEFFASLGLVWREEADGRQYPLANKASVVVDVLRAALARYHVNVECEVPVAVVDAPRKPGKPFTLRLRDGVFRRADAVVVACGGRALDALDVDCIPRLELQPVLGPLRVASDDIPLVRELDNIRVKCAVTLMRQRGERQQELATEVGELMFRKYGVSGICVFNLSRLAEPGDVLSIDFLQVGDAEGVQRFLLERRALLQERFGERLTYADLLRGLVLPRVSEALLKHVGISPDAPFTVQDAPALADLLARFPLHVKGIADPDISQVRRGGLAVEAFDAATLQALSQPGLFAAGEALDVDGPCGGYNLHWAWSSGLVAGAAAVDALA